MVILITKLEDVHVMNDAWLSKLLRVDEIGRKSHWRLLGSSCQQQALKGVVGGLHGCDAKRL